MKTTARNRSNVLRYYVAAALGSTLIAAPAWAADEETLEEVVVTAQKREQNIQDVPIAISAFSGSLLKEKSIGDIGALTRFAPNVNLDTGSPFSGDTSVLSASIRGIGQDDFAFNLDPGVGVYLDGVYLARTIGANQSLLDIDRIEILKGPQGTLFGRNTIGGAISIVTHTPGEKPMLTASVTGGSYDRQDIAISADYPFSDNFLTTISFSSQQRDGYQDVIPFPTDSELGQVPWVVDPQTAFPKAGTATADSKGGQNVQVVRGKALWKVSDKFNVTIAGDYTYQNQPSYPTTVLAVITPAGDALPNPFQALPGPAFGFMGANYNFCISQPEAVLNDPVAFTTAFPGAPPFWGTGVGGLCGPRAQGLGLATGGAPLGGVGYVGGPVAYTPGGAAGNPSGPTPRIYWSFENTDTGDIDKTYATGPSFARYTAWGGSVTLDYDISESMSFKSITAARGIDWRVGVDLDGLPESIQEVTDHQKQDQFSQEFQLAGRAFDDKMEYVAGLFYFQEDGFVHDFVPFGSTLYIYDVANDVDTKSYAAFFHIDYQVSDSFGVTVGARYSKDDKKFEGGQADLDGYNYKSSGCFDPVTGPDMDCWAAFASLPFINLAPFPDSTNPYRYFPPGEQSQDYSVFTPTVGAQWHINDDQMLYLSYSEGFKAGGWTTRLSNPLFDIAGAAFGPEDSTSYELGWKSQFLDHRVQVNTAVFWTDYNNIQLQIQEQASPVSQNAGDAELKGAELELNAIVGGGFSLYVGAAYIDAEYTRLLPNVTFAPDSDLPKTPEYKYTISPQFDVNLANTGKLRFAVDYTKTASMFNDAPNTPQLFRPATDNLGAAIHYFSPGDKYSITLGGTNLTDDRYLTVGSVNGAQGEIVGTYNPPRQWYLNFRANFE
ncbi:MAG TPA: TonB-dependent receptor [Steroidobacteraceae bacterium]|nr:TonB-dependent receptor [Steroidobacteraceae bacterium]